MTGVFLGCLTHLTPIKTFLLEKLNVTQLVKIYSAFHWCHVNKKLAFLSSIDKFFFTPSYRSITLSTF